MEDDDDHDSAAEDELFLRASIGELGSDVEIVSETKGKGSDQSDDSDSVDEVEKEIRKEFGDEEDEGDRTFVFDFGDKKTPKTKGGKKVSLPKGKEKTSDSKGRKDRAFEHKHNVDKRYYDFSGCDICGDSEHVSMNCQKPCFKCGEFGHSRVSCRTPICFRCGFTGHMSKDCRERSEKLTYNEHSLSSIMVSLDRYSKGSRRHSSGEDYSRSASTWEENRNQRGNRRKTLEPEPKDWNRNRNQNQNRNSNWDQDYDYNPDDRGWQKDKKGYREDRGREDEGRGRRESGGRDSGRWESGGSDRKRGREGEDEDWKHTSGSKRKRGEEEGLGKKEKWSRGGGKGWDVDQDFIPFGANDEEEIWNRSGKMSKKNSGTPKSRQGTPSNNRNNYDNTPNNNKKGNDQNNDYDYNFSHNKQSTKQKKISKKYVSPLTEFAKTRGVNSKGKKGR